MNILIKIVFLVLCLIHLSGCASLRATKLGEIETYANASDLERQCIITQLRAGEAEVSTFRSLINMTINDGSSRYDLKEVVIFERPDSARIEFLRPGINQVESMLLIRDGEIVAYSLSKQAGYRGQATGENLFRLIGVPLNPDELMLWLAGKLYIEDDSRVFVKKDNAGKYYLEMAHVDGRTFYVVLDVVGTELCAPGALRLKHMEIVGGETDLGFYCSYKYADNAVAQVVPRIIDFELSKIDLKGSLLLDAPSLNIDLSKKREKLFRLKLPPTIEFQQIENMEESSLLLPLR